MITNNISSGILTIVALTFLTGCGNDISLVKDGVLPEYSNSVKVGNVIDSWAKTQECSDTKWEALETERGEKVIQFTCELNVSKFQTKEDMASNITEEALAAAEKDVAKAKADLRAAIVSRNTVANIAAIEAENITTAKMIELQGHFRQKSLKEAKIIFQFNIAVDGNTFTAGYQGGEIVFDNGKKSEIAASLLDAYYNVKKDI
jgi:hypothetical protein